MPLATAEAAVGIVMIKKTVKRLIRAAGWDLHRFVPSASAEAQLSRCLATFAIDTVFDVGANAGQFASGIRSAGFDGKIISFEPLSDARKQLLKSAAQDPKWIVHSQTAIGHEDGEIEMNISGNSVSSSVLTMLDSHSTAAVDSAYVGVERVPIHRLDSIADQYLEQDSKLFIKIDTQGYESQVIKGGERTIGKATGILCEMSVVPLYEGQMLWEEMIDQLKAKDFVLWALFRGFTDPRTGRTLQVDGLFVRKTLDV